MAWQPKDLYPGGPDDRGKKRPRQVGDVIKNEIAMLLLRKIKDPRVTKVSITKVVMSNDLRQAMIHYSVLGDARQIKEAGAGLASAKGFIRSHLARELNLRFTPQLDFKYDNSLARQEEMERLLKELDYGDEETP